MKHLGDITKISGYECPAVDVITGGSPCQDLSVAGKRAGLAGERSGLFMEQVRIVKEMRKRDCENGRTDKSIRCRFLVWENVVGAMSSGQPKGADFQAVLTEIVRIVEPNAPDVPMPDKGKWPKAGFLYDELGRWSVAYRVHDAQYWGVPQRRRRISLVADLGGKSAPEILFECEGVFGNPEQSGTSGQGASEDSQRCADASSWTLKVRGGVERDRYGKRAGKGALVQTELSGTLGVSQDQTLVECLGLNRERCGAVYGEDLMPTLQAAAGESGNNKPMVCTKEPLLLESNQNHATVQTDGISTALPASMGEGGGYVPMVLNDQGGSQMSVSEDVSGTLRAQEHGHQPCVIQGADMYNQEITGDIAATLSANSCMTATRSGPSVIEHTFSLQGGGATSQNAQGLGVNEDVSFTLNGVDRHAVAYRKTSHAKTADDGQGWQETDTNDTLNAFDQGEQRTPTIVLENHPADSRVKVSEDGVFQALTSRMGTGGGNVPMVMEDNVTASKASYFMKTDSEDRAQTLVATDYKDPQIVAYDARNGNESEVNGALQSSSCHNVNSNNTCRVNSIVRRLTPKECERLQGFPDGWTDIGDWTDSKGKKHKGDSDSPRYKALGNSIALPFWRWMARRMVAVLKRDGCEHPTMASLFDGIGGFPLVYSECGCEPIWASEIEEFPIAVTKLRFPEE